MSFDSHLYSQDTVLPPTLKCLPYLFVVNLSSALNPWQPQTHFEFIFNRIQDKDWSSFFCMWISIELPLTMYV